MISTAEKVLSESWLDEPALLLNRSYFPVSEWGASTGFDSGDPFCLRKIDSITMLAIDRNSLCQFWKVSNQKLACAK